MLSNVKLSSPPSAQLWIHCLTKSGKLCFGKKQTPSRHSQHKDANGRKNSLFSIFMLSWATCTDTEAIANSTQTKFCCVLVIIHAITPKHMNTSCGVNRADVHRIPLPVLLAPEPIIWGNLNKKKSANICWTIQANVQAAALWHSATRHLISIPEASIAVLCCGNTERGNEGSWERGKRLGRKGMTWVFYLAKRNAWVFRLKNILTRTHTCVSTASSRSRQRIEFCYKPAQGQESAEKKAQILDREITAWENIWNCRECLMF